MMFQQMTEIALRGLAYVMGRPKGQVIQSHQIGEHLGISGTYVAKAFQPFARAEWLRSVKGRAGGWVLEFDPGEHTVMDAVDVLEPGDTWKRCAIGDVVCADDIDCAFHDTWQHTIAEFERVMEATNLARLPDFLPPCQSYNGRDRSSGRGSAKGRGSRSGATLNPEKSADV